MKLYDILDYGILVRHEYEKLSQNLLELDLTVNEKIQKWYDDWLEYQEQKNYKNN